jgi:hypothetical protein
MAQADPFPSSATRALAAELAEWLAASELPTTDVTLAEAPLSIWDLRSGPLLGEAAVPSGEWHHQIRHRGNAIAFARSVLHADGRVKLIKLAESPLVSEIETAFSSLRTSAHTPATLRLIRILRNHTTCLWLHRQGAEDDEIITLRSPIWPPGLRVDEVVFLQMVRALPGPGAIASSNERRLELAPAWDRKGWLSSRNRPVRGQAKAS